MLQTNIALLEMVSHACVVHQYADFVAAGFAITVTLVKGRPAKPCHKLQLEL